jgi:hypothetical protein
MTRRRSGTNWSQLRSLIENSLRRQQLGFQKNLQLEGKIQTLGEGLFHENYIFEAGDRELVLRLAKVERGLQSRTEAIGAVRRESKTLQTLQSLLVNRIEDSKPDGRTWPRTLCRSPVVHLKTRTRSGRQ